MAASKDRKQVKPEERIAISRAPTGQAKSIRVLFFTTCHLTAYNPGCIKQPVTTAKTTTRTIALVLIETSVEVIETTGEEAPGPPLNRVGPGLRKCWPFEALRLAGGAR